MLKSIGTLQVNGAELTVLHASGKSPELKIRAMCSASGPSHPPLIANQQTLSATFTNDVAPNGIYSARPTHCELNDVGSLYDLVLCFQGPAE